MNVFNLQNSVSPVMSQFIFFHDQSLVILIFISILVAGLVILIYKNTFSTISFVDNQYLEFF